MLALTLIVLGYMSEPSLFELYEKAELVVVGTVIEVARQSASLSLEQVFKGAPEKTVRYDTKRTWACDTSDAVLGERKLMFLYRVEGTWRIEASGRGRRDPDPDVLALLTRKLAPSTFTVTRPTCPACPLPAPATRCYDRECMQAASDLKRPFLGELYYSPPRYLGGPDGEIHALRATRIGECRARIDVSRCESADCESPEPVSSTEHACAGWAPGTETSKPLPASMLHCKERDRDCLVIARPGYDVQPAAIGEHLSCSFNGSGRLDCWRAP